MDTKVAHASPDRPDPDSEHNLPFQLILVSWRPWGSYAWGPHWSLQTQNLASDHGNGIAWRLSLSSHNMQKPCHLRLLARATCISITTCSEVLPWSTAPVTRNCGEGDGPTIAFWAGRSHKKSLIPRIWDQYCALFATPAFLTFLKRFSSFVNMGGFARAPEDRPTPPEVYNWRVYMAALVISMGVLAYGYGVSKT